MASNHLIHEKSPYLLQHAHNPVNWYPWSDAAFERAKAEDKPIFLSIGYATCHWCHVMEKESFEDAEAARHLNETFVCIKVDREERPDIDAVYMAACQMLTGRGGWPLTIFMTPDKKPFFAGTYIPKLERFGQGGLIDLCEQIRSLWKNERQRVLDSAVSVTGHLGKAFEFAPAADIGEPVLNLALTQIRSSFDPEYGGFDPAPKFPTPHRLGFLLRRYYATGEADILQMVEKTLVAMRLGGMWDHAGFGFHRYSTDAEWLVPHFEKMLYDQALLAIVYLETFQITKNPFYSRTAEEILEYLLRDMHSDSGGFFAAEDADSEGEEGKFYVWTRAGFRNVLGTDEAVFWEKIFNIQEDGNFADESTGRKTGANILYLTRPLSEWAAEMNLPPDDLAERWEKARQKLFAARKTRIHPLRDDKILTDWNGMAIAALALGARILHKPVYAEAACKAVKFVEDHLQTPDGGLLHRFRDGESAISGHADDYAFFIRGLLELYRTTFEPEYLARAVQLQNIMNRQFHDPENGGFFLTASGETDLPVRPKELYDGAIPSANSTALLNLLLLARLTGNTDMAAEAGALSRVFSGSVHKHPPAFTAFLCASEFALGRSGEIVIAGEPDAPDTLALLDIVNRHFLPHHTVILKSRKTAGKLAELAPYTVRLEPLNGRAVAYLCTGFACKQPVSDPQEFEKMLLKP